MAKVPNGEEKLPKISTSRVHQRYRQMTDRLAIAYSEREFTFAKNSRFEPPCGGLRGNARVRLWLDRWKAHCRLPMSDN